VSPSLVRLSHRTRVDDDTVHRICAIASRFYTKDPTLRPKLATVTKKLMLETPARGYKSLEMVQAYILLICWTLGPEERWEQDLSYLLLGMAIR
jgi:hypothetical protein